MEVIPLGIVMLFKPQSLKAALPIYSTVVGIVILSKLRQPSKALIHIDVTPSGIITLFTPEFRKALPPMEVTG